MYSERGRAVCADNKVRAVEMGPADTFFSRKARVKVKGRTVTGFVVWTQGYLQFSADSWRKNHDLLPKW